MIFKRFAQKKDSLYGVSKLKGFILNIYSSSAIEVIDDHDKRLSCVKKFVRLNKHLEPNDKELINRLNFIESRKISLSQAKKTQCLGSSI